MLQFCWMTLSLYGKKPDDYDIMAESFMIILMLYPAHAVEDAFKRYVETAREFPAPADIIRLVKGEIVKDSIYYSELCKRRGALSYTEEIYIKKYENQTLES